MFLNQVVKQSVFHQQEELICFIGYRESFVLTEAKLRKPQVLDNRVKILWKRFQNSSSIQNIQ